MGPVWVAGLAVILVLTGPCFCDKSANPSDTTATNADANSRSKANETAIETATDLDEYESLPEAASLTGEQEWIDGPEDGSEDETLEEDTDDIETAGSEIVSTVVKQDETGKGEEEPGVRRRRKKGRKRRRRMRKRPRTTTTTSAEAEVYPTPPPIVSEEPEKVSLATPDEQSETYPRRRPGKRRRRPWSRPSTEAPLDTPDIQELRGPEEQQSLAPEETSEEPQTPAPRPRRRKRPKHRTKIPIEIVNSQETTETTKSEDTAGLPENHKQYDGKQAPERYAPEHAKGTGGEVVSLIPKEEQERNRQPFSEQSSRATTPFDENDDLKTGKQVVQKGAPNKVITQYPLEQRPINVEQKPKEYISEQKPKDNQEQRIKVYPLDQKPRDYFGGEQQPRDYLSVGQKPKEYATEQKPRDFLPSEQKPKESPNSEQKFKDYQNFGPTNRPSSNKQQFQQKNPKHPEVGPNKDPGPVFQNIPFRPNGYDGFQQYQKIYGNDPSINSTQQNRQKHQEQPKVQTEKALKPTASSSLRVQDNTNERQSTTKVPPKFVSTNTDSFGNLQPSSRDSKINNSGYGQGYGPPKPTHGSLPQPPKETKPEHEKPSGFQSYQKPIFNMQQGPVQYSKPKPIGTKDTEPQSTTYKPSGFPHKLQNENLLSYNRPENSQYQKPPSGFQANQNFHENSHRNKGAPPSFGNEGFHKNVKPDGSFGNAPLLVNGRVPSVPQQNILKQIVSQNHQFPAQASVIVSDLETNSAKPQYDGLDDLHSKLRPQSIEQFNHQLVDPTLLTSPVLFEPPVPPVFEDDVQATKLPVSKVQLPPIQYPKAKFPPAPFLPSSQKQLPNTQFQRQADPAPFRLPQKPDPSLTPISLPTQSTFQQPFTNQKKAPPQIPNVPKPEKGKQSIHVPPLENNEEKPFVPTNILQTTTTESETISYVDVQTTKAPVADTTTRKTSINHSKRLPPTSAVIRKRVRPRPSKNSNETVQTQESDNKENLSEKYRGGNRGKNSYRQHLTEIEPSQKTPDQLEPDQNRNYESDSSHKSLSAYGNDGVFTNYEAEETIKPKQNKPRYTTSFPESIIEETTSKPGRFGLHHVSAQQEILRQTLQKQSKDTVRIEESTDVPFASHKSPVDEIEVEDSTHESNPPPVFTSSKKTHSFTPRKHGYRQRTRGPETILVTTSTTPKISLLEIITDQPKYSTSDEYEFMVSDEELLKMMKPMMGEDFTDQRDTEELRFKAANIHGVKDEILDLIKTDAGSARLSRILRLRNMSLDDLIKHRERGSSQLHLSEIFTQKQHLEPTIQPESPEIFSVPNYVQNSDDDITAQITPIFESNYIKNKGEADRTKASVSVTEIKTFESGDHNDKDSNREPKVFESMPSFTLRTDILEQINEKKENPQKTDSSWRFFGQVNKPQRPYEDVVISYTSTNRYPYRKPSVEEIDDIILLSDTEQYDAPRSNVIHAKVLADSGGERRDQEFFNETKKLSTGVKSAILVSGAIIGIAVLGFFALMISCRIKQKKARLRAQRDILCDHFHEELRSSARSTSPVMPPGMEENTCEHGVRSTAIPTRHYNNRHYYLWRTLRKTFQYE